MTPALNEHVASLHQLLLRASLNYDIWWVYKSRQTRPVYVETMNRHLKFFSAGIHAHFLAYVAAMYAMYETRKDTYNCSQLLKLFAAEPGISAQQVSEARALLNLAKPIWLKVGILRNEVFAHASANTSTSAAFKKAAVSPDEFAELLDLSRRLLNAIRVASGSGRHSYNQSAHDQAIKVLEILKRAK